MNPKPAITALLLLASVMPAQGLEVDAVSVAAGPFIQGSDRAEREAAYKLDEAAYGHTITRDNKWYESEPPRGEIALPGFEIMRNLVTNEDYAKFVSATGHRAPDVDKATWDGYRLNHRFPETRQFAWTDGQPPGGREKHPVVLVSKADAEAYAKWLGEQTGQAWTLPSEQQWEKAARGLDGRRYPWGDEFDPAKLNSHDKGPNTTMPAGSFADGASPFGMLDAAGQVFEWTTSAAAAGRTMVRGGGGWDDSGCGVCRAAARHSRPGNIRHILIGFRLVRSTTITPN